MKLPICEICAKTKIMCAGCEDKVKTGGIADLDVKVSTLLFEMNSKYNLENADLYKAVDLGKIILILTRGEVGVLIGKEGKVVSELSQKLGKKVRIAEYSGDLKKTISDMIVPAKLVGINQVYLPDGKISYKVRLLRSEMKQLPVDINTLEKALNSLFGGKSRIDFE